MGSLWSSKWSSLYRTGVTLADLINREALKDLSFAFCSFNHMRGYQTAFVRLLQLICYDVVENDAEFTYWDRIGQGFKIYLRKYEGEEFIEKKKLGDLVGQDYVKSGGVGYSLALRMHHDRSLAKERPKDITVSDAVLAVLMEKVNEGLNYRGSKKTTYVDYLPFLYKEFDYLNFTALCQIISRTFENIAYVINMRHFVRIWSPRMFSFSTRPHIGIKTLEEKYYELLNEFSHRKMVIMYSIFEIKSDYEYFWLRSTDDVKNYAIDGVNYISLPNRRIVTSQMIDVVVFQLRPDKIMFRAKKTHFPEGFKLPFRFVENPVFEDVEMVLLPEEVRKAKFLDTSNPYFYINALKKHGAAMVDDIRIEEAKGRKRRSNTTGPFGNYVYKLDDLFGVTKDYAEEVFG